MLRVVMSRVLLSGVLLLLSAERLPAQRVRRSWLSFRLCSGR